MKKFLHKYFGPTKWKRLFDIVVSFVALVILSPLFLIICLINLFTPDCKVFFSHERRGRRGKPFTIYKFQTMKNSTPNCATGELENPDQYITKFGRILRKTSLDELPQLWNILKGDMSFVGPRPPLPNEVEQYTEEQKRRLSVTPGLTCYWQVQPSRNDLDFDEWFELDMKYIRERSMKIDIKIIFQTILVVLHMEGV